MQDPSQKYQKIKNNLKKLNGVDGEVMVYQDQSDDDKEFNQVMADGEEYESDEESDADEEIEQIDI